MELKNPHSILAALEKRPGDVIEVRVSGARPPAAWNDVLAAAARRQVPVRRAEGGREGRRSRGGRSAAKSRSGVNCAVVRERGSVDLSELFADAGTVAAAGRQSEVRNQASGIRGQALNSQPRDHSPLTIHHSPRVFLALDRIQDPHNVGAIFRTAAFFGVRGIVLTRDRSAPLSAAVYDVASGGIEHVPFSVQPNLSRALEEAKKAGLWVLGTSEHAQEPLSSVERDRGWLAVLGGEERGLRRLTLKSCDVVCRIPAAGPVRSLNVSVAAGIVMNCLCGGEE